MASDSLTVSVNTSGISILNASVTKSVNVSLNVTVIQTTNVTVNVSGNMIPSSSKNAMLSVNMSVNESVSVIARVSPRHLNCYHPRIHVRILRVICIPSLQHSSWLYEELQLGSCLQCRPVEGNCLNQSHQKFVVQTFRRRIAPILDVVGF